MVLKCRGCIGIACANWQMKAVSSLPHSGSPDRALCTIWERALKAVTSLATTPVYVSSLSVKQRTSQKYFTKVLSTLYKNALATSIERIV